LDASFANIFHNKNALLGKTRYSLGLYSFCHSTDLQGHSRWRIFMLFESQLKCNFLL